MMNMKAQLLTILMYSATTSAGIDYMDCLYDNLIPTGCNWDNQCTGPGDSCKEMGRVWGSTGCNARMGCQWLPNYHQGGNEDADYGYGEDYGAASMCSECWYDWASYEMIMYCCDNSGYNCWEVSCNNRRNLQGGLFCF